MKRTIIGLLVFFVLAMAAQAVDVYPTGVATIDVQSVRDAVALGGTVVLHSHKLGETGPTAFDFGSDNVMVTNPVEIIGDGETDGDGNPLTTIVNGHPARGCIGVRGVSGSQTPIAIKKITFKNQPGAGILANYCKGGLIEGNVFTGSRTAGIMMYINTSDYLIKDNKFYGFAGYNIVLYEGNEHNQVIGNVMDNFADNCIWLHKGNVYNTISDNIITSRYTGAAGIYLHKDQSGTMGNHYNTISNNTIVGVAEYGILLVGTSHNNQITVYQGQIETLNAAEAHVACGSDTHDNKFKFFDVKRGDVKIIDKGKDNENEFEWLTK